MKTKLLLLLLVISTSINAQFTENFDNYNLGSMRLQNPDLWSTWYGVYSNNAHMVVDDTNFVSGSQAGYVGPYDVTGNSEATTDAFLLLGNKISGQWNLTFQMYIPTNNSGYFNIQGALSEIGAVSYPTEFIGGNIHFNKENTNAGIGEFQGTTSINFNFPHDAWFPVEIIFDVDNKTYQIKVNNSIVNTTLEDFGNIQNTTTQIEVLGAIDFYSVSIENSYWIDDIVFTGSSIHTYIPDNNFEQALINLGFDTSLDNKFVSADLSSLTTIDISNKNIDNLVGLSAMTSLQNINCSANNLVRLDLRDNTQLLDINCSNNNITKLIFTEDDNMQERNANSTTNLTGFQSLDCSDNLLTTLDLSNNTALTNLNCNNNKLEKLDVRNGNNTNIITFDARNNRLITCIFVDNSAYSTTNWVNIESISSFVENQTACENILTYVPDDNFEQRLILAGYDDVMDDYVKTINIRTVKNLELVYDYSGNGYIFNFTGLEKFIGLETLKVTDFYLYENNLNVSNMLLLNDLDISYGFSSSIDLSNNVLLKKFDARWNLLTNIDVLQNIDLEELYTSGNDFLNLNITHLSKLKHLSYGNSNLGNVDLTQNLKLESLSLSNVNSLNVNQNPLLNALTILNTSLPYINVSQNPLLNLINCQDNPNLININLTQNHELGTVFFKNNASLRFIDIRNGNNNNIGLFGIQNCTSLLCTMVDNKIYSTNNWNIYSDSAAITTYKELDSECSVISVSDENIDEFVTIFPNPTIDIINIEIDSRIDNVKIYDSLGRLIQTTTKKVFSIGNLENGIYMFVITDTNGNKSHKQIIKK